ncbi:MAG: hypothetical protein ABF946_06030, partial [Acetobacter papayae]
GGSGRLRCKGSALIHEPVFPLGGAIVEPVIQGGGRLCHVMEGVPGVAGVRNRGCSRIREQTALCSGV